MANESVLSNKLVRAKRVGNTAESFRRRNVASDIASRWKAAVVAASVLLCGGGAWLVPVPLPAAGATLGVWVAADAGGIELVDDGA